MPSTTSTPNWLSRRTPPMSTWIYRTTLRRSLSLTPDPRSVLSRTRTWSNQSSLAQDRLIINGGYAEGQSLSYLLRWNSLQRLHQGSNAISCLRLPGKRDAGRTPRVEARGLPRRRNGRTAIYEHNSLIEQYQGSNVPSSFPQFHSLEGYGTVNAIKAVIFLPTER